MKRWRISSLHAYLCPLSTNLWWLPLPSPTATTTLLLISPTSSASLLSPIQSDDPTPRPRLLYGYNVKTRKIPMRCYGRKRPWKRASFYGRVRNVNEGVIVAELVEQDGVRSSCRHGKEKLAGGSKMTTHGLGGTERHGMKQFTSLVACFESVAN
uniref:Uncharacterized protein n=1 Tax=Oryza rufipogon TaxID=4529 RepID=A0A0E0QFV1_ORYRU